MRIQIRKKLLLVLAIAATQAFCLIWGVVVFNSWLADSIRETVQQQVLKENVETAKQMAKLIDAMGVDDPRASHESWSRLQSTVSGINLPNEGYVCLVDAVSGEVLCHPELTAHPTLAEPPSAKKLMDAKKPMPGKAGMMPDKAPMMAKGSMPPKTDMVAKAEMMEKKAWAKPPMAENSATDADSGDELIGETTSGVLDGAEGLQIVAATELPGINARLLVHQMGHGIDEAVARVIKPVWPIGLSVSLGLVVLTSLAVAAVVRRYENRLAEINEGLEDLVERRTRSLMKTRNAVIFGLAKLAESRDTDTGEHLDRIRTYVTILAEQMRRHGEPLEQEYIDTLALASSLHDIGKVGVPDAVLLKPGRLDSAERAIIETHAKIGGDCLQAMSDRLGEDDFLQVAEEIAYGHHERWDGGGYPFGVAGESIPLSARIVAVADVYDALRSKRPYKDGMTHERARQILVEDSGSHFDPLVIEAFLAAEEEFSSVEPEATPDAVEAEVPELATV